MQYKFKRYCKTLELIDNPELIREYKKLHAPGSVWSEITAGMKKVGILDMEIYLSGTTLFMIMDTVEHFNHEAAMTKLGTLPRQAEWEAVVSKYQKTSTNSSAQEKWRLVERVFKMNQEKEEQALDGYEEKINIES